MGFLDKIRNTLLGTELDGEDEFFEGNDYSDESQDDSHTHDRRTEREYPEFGDYRHKKSDSKYTDPKVLSIHAEPRERIMITKPKSIEEAPMVTDYLLANMACVINLESVEHAEAQRIADFLGGTAYALNCEVERVNNEVFVIAPSTMNVASEIRDEIKNGGTILPWIASAFK